MANRKTFDDMMNEIKASGEQERETIEVAEKLAKIIGDLSRARIRKGLSQRQLAEMTGIKQSAIARLENIQAIPRLDTIIKIARCLDVEIEIEEVTTRVNAPKIGMPSFAYTRQFFQPGAVAAVSIDKKQYAMAGGYYGTAC